MKNYEYTTYKKCYKLEKNSIKNKITSKGLSEDLFDALKTLYENVNFQEVSDGATRRNNKLLFGENNITILNYTHKYFDSTEKNLCFDKERINLVAKMSKIMTGDDLFKNCMDLKLIIPVSKEFKVTVRYKLLINNINYVHIERFLKIYEMSKYPQ